MLCKLRSVSVKCDLKKYLRAFREHCVNLVMHSRLGVGFNMNIS